MLPLLRAPSRRPGKLCSDYSEGPAKAWKVCVQSIVRPNQKPGKLIFRLLRRPSQRPGKLMFRSSWGPSQGPGKLVFLLLWAPSRRPEKLCSDYNEGPARAWKAYVQLTVRFLIRNLWCVHACTCMYNSFHVEYQDATLWTKISQITCLFTFNLWEGFVHPVRSIGVTLGEFLLMDCAASRSVIIQRRCRILGIALTTCRVHTTLVRYGYEYLSLRLNINIQIPIYIYVYIYMYIYISYL